MSNTPEQSRRIYSQAAPSRQPTFRRRRNLRPLITTALCAVVMASGTSVWFSLWGTPQLDVSSNFRNLTLKFETPDHQTTRMLYYGDNPEQLLDLRSLTALPKQGCEITRSASNLRPGVYILIAQPISTFPGRESYLAREVQRYRVWSQNLYEETAIRRCHASYMNTAYRIRTGWTALIIDRYSTRRGPFTNVLMDPDQGN